MNVLVTGAYGFVGTNLCNKLESLGYKVYKVGRYKSNLLGKVGDLKDPDFVRRLFCIVNVDIVYHLAARVGGIIANNTYKESFYYDNTLINTNVIHEAIEHRIPKIIAIGTGCSYSDEDCTERVLTENRILSGKPKKEHATYAYSKRNMLVHLMSAEDIYDLTYYMPIPANIYGPYDDFDYVTSHVMASLVRRIVEAKQSGKDSVDILGSVTTERDFVYVSDFVDALIKLSDCLLPNGAVNIATGKLTKIMDLIYLISDIVGYNGSFNYLGTVLTGQFSRKFSTTKLDSIGWIPKVRLEEGIRKTVAWYVENNYDNQKSCSC